MVEAVRTTASTAGIWVIVVVAVGLLAFWLSAIFLADRSQVRASGRYRQNVAAGLASGEDERAGAGLSGEQAAAVPDAMVNEPAGVRGRPAREESVPEGDIPTRADLPVQPTGPHPVPAQLAGRDEMPAQPAGKHAMPAQRTGDTDRAERTYAGPSAPDEDEETGQSGEPRP
jgi:hypothetical protein